MRLRQHENGDSGHSRENSTGRLNADYIRTYLGLMGSGKTTRALQDVANHPRLIVYSPGSTNPLMLSLPYILDTDDYLKDFWKLIERCPRLRIEKRTYPSPMFRYLATVRECAILIDDIAALKTTGQERNEFEAFIRTVRFNGNIVLLTTHRARGDIPPLVRVIGTSFYWVGAGTRSKKEIETLFELTNYPISMTEFVARMEANRPAEKDANERVVRPADVLTVRQA